MILIAAELKAQRFQADGQLVYSVLDQDQTVGFVLHKNFSISRDGCRWLIRTSNANNTDDPSAIYLYEEAGCDGTNIYTYSLVDTNRLPPPPDPKKKTLWANAYVEEGIVPFPDDTLFFHVWLVYASSCYFRSVEGRIKPVSSLKREQFDDPSFSVRAEWEFSDRSSNFLSQIRYLTDDTYRYQDAAGIKHEIPYPPPVKGGYTNAILSILSFTNRGGLRVPMNFQITEYGNSFETKTKVDIFKRAEIVGTITNLTLSAPKSYLPEITTEAAAIDMRFAKTGRYQLQYKLTNWYAKNDPKLAAMNNTFVKANPQLVGKPQASAVTVFQKRLVVFGLFLLTSIPLIWLLIHKKHNQTGKQK